MKRSGVAFACGAVFGGSLTVAGCGDANVIIGFLDVTGAWRPHLAAVIGAALAVNLVMWPLVIRRGKPLFDEKFALPTRTDLDASLIGGSLLFGVGWGIGGYCAGPSLAGLLGSPANAGTYLAGLIVGYFAYGFATAPAAKVAEHR